MLGLELVKDTVLAHLEGEDAEAWLFGSRARHAAHRRSDIDVGILPRRTIGRA